MACREIDKGELQMEILMVLKLFNEEKESASSIVSSIQRRLKNHDETFARIKASKSEIRESLNTIQQIFIGGNKQAKTNLLELVSVKQEIKDMILKFDWLKE